MTTSVLPSRRVETELARPWEERILLRRYEPDLMSRDSTATALLGMGMTEKQGGSDVRANTTTAEPDGAGCHRITGHKWFTSAPMNDAFLILAQAPGGLTCFLLPRLLPDGTRNGIRIQRLKDKLGNRSNASSEIELEGATAWRVGEEGRGVRTIIEMVNHTRLDCVVGSVGLMRQAVTQAGWHAAHRAAFGAPLIDKPLMQNVLADLEIEVEAATLLMMRLSGAFDRADADPVEAAFRRLATPVVKYWVTKRCTPVIHEALECLGGSGYVEESILPRLFRESPLNAVWEGSGNVIALDVLRALARDPDSTSAFLSEIGAAAGLDLDLDRVIGELTADLESPVDPERNARRLVERMAVTLAASLFARHGEGDAAEAYLGSRLTGDHGAMFGTLAGHDRLARIARRTVPAA
jgi:putative acyl-CoA dehydrogenase